MKNNFVRENEIPQRTITDGNKTYLCYPDYGVTEKATPGWGVEIIDKTDENDVPMLWAGGTKDKIHKIDNLSSLTFTTLK